MDEKVGVIRVMVVDDHPFVRAGVSLLLNSADGIKVVGECADGADVVRESATLEPDVVLMDLRMPIMSGTDATRRLMAQQPSVRVIILTSRATGGTLDEAADAGAVGYVLKGGDPDYLVNAIRTVAAGGTAWPADATTAP